MSLQYCRYIKIPVLLVVRLNHQHVTSISDNWWKTWKSSCLPYLNPHFCLPLLAVRVTAQTLNERMKPKEVRTNRFWENDLCQNASPPLTLRGSCGHFLQYSLFVFYFQAVLASLDEYNINLAKISIFRIQVSVLKMHKHFYQFQGTKIAIYDSMFILTEIKNQHELMLFLVP